MIIRPRWSLVALASVSASALTWFAAAGVAVIPPATPPANHRPAVAAAQSGAGKGSLAPVMAAVSVPAQTAPVKPSVAPPAANAAAAAPSSTPAPLPAAKQALTPTPFLVPQDQDELQDPDFLDDDAEESESELTTTIQEDQAAAPKAVQSSKNQAPAPAGDELTQLTRRLQENPDDAVALNNLAVLYAGKADMQGFAESLFGLLESLRPSDPTIAANLAAHRLHLSRKDKSLQFGRKGQLLTVSAVTTVARAGSPW